MTASDEERAACALLLRLADPGDKNLRDLVILHGVLGALDRLRSAHPPEGSERWLPRLAAADPERDLERARDVGARLVVPGDDEWPGERVRSLDVPPLGLWVRGALDVRILTGRSVAIVGSRASTAYGEHVAADLAADLAGHGWTVVSGGAYGIDGAAHRAALAVGGLTLAVLANGVDGAYPRGHTALLARIASEGLVVSELSPGEQPTRGRFIERNRVIAALAVGTVAVEMALRSGASATVDRAHDLGRVYMAVPGPVTSPTSAGCHHWIAVKGAELVTCAADVLTLVAPLGEAIEAPTREAPRPTDLLDPDARRLWEALPVSGTRRVADLSAAAGVAPRDVGAGLAALVAAGLADSNGSSAWRVNPPTR